MARGARLMKGRKSRNRSPGRATSGLSVECRQFVLWKAGLETTMPCPSETLDSGMRSKDEVLKLPLASDCWGEKSFSAALLLALDGAGCSDGYPSASNTSGLEARLRLQACTVSNRSNMEFSSLSNQILNYLLQWSSTSEEAVDRVDSAKLAPMPRGHQQMQRGWVELKGKAGKMHMLPGIHFTVPVTPVAAATAANDDNDEQVRTCSGSGVG